MAFQPPPIRSEELEPYNRGQDRIRIRAQETPVLPEPRTYYAAPTTGNTVLSSGTLTNFGVVVPIFWRPGNTVGVMAQYANIASTTVNTVSLLIGGLPLNTGGDSPIIVNGLVDNTAQTTATRAGDGGSTGANLSGLYPWVAGTLYMTPTPGLTPATSPGVFNLQFKLQRTSGSGTITANTLRVWIQVF